MPPPPPFMYPTSRPQPMFTTAAAYPPVSIYGPTYGPYAMPHPSQIYDYYGGMRAPIPTTYASYAAPVQEPTKPPPGINYKPMKEMPTATQATGIPLYKCATWCTSFNHGSYFEHTALNTCCCCGLDCSLNAAPSKQSGTPSAEHSNKPEWISKLEVVRDLVNIPLQVCLLVSL